MNDQYEYAEKPLTPKIAQYLILELFAGQTVQKQEMMNVVDETHRERGGLPSRARFHHPVTLALSNMKRSGLVDNPSQGIWIIHSEEMDPESSETTEELVETGIVSEKTIGSGGGSVYLYYYPVYQRLAELEGEEVWPCKIGKTRSDAINRVISQTRTALPEYPKVGLIIKTDELRLMENTIQNILKLQGKHIQNAPGTEWFLTSPGEVERVYENNFGNSQ